MGNRPSLFRLPALAKFTCKSRAGQRYRRDLTRLWQCCTPFLSPKRRRHSRRWPNRILTVAWRIGDSLLRPWEVCTEEGQGHRRARENRQPKQLRASVQKPPASADTSQPSVFFIRTLEALVTRLGCVHTRRHCSDYTKSIPMTAKPNSFTPDRKSTRLNSSHLGSSY